MSNLLPGLAGGFSLHGWSRSDVLALIGVLVAIVIAAVPAVRKGLVESCRALLLRAGLPRRKYTGWFIRTWGAYENPYLDDRENLDLSNTFVPLSFTEQGAQRETVSVATAVLGDWGAGNLVIDGAPGSGKSTLMKAYGVGMSMAGWLPGRQGHAIPFLIQLRKLARYGDRQVDIAEYLATEILVSGAGMKQQQARRFLRYSLGKGRVLVMLDGLDEVTADRYPAVLEAVYRFVGDHSPDCPSHLARVIVTCRRQNFLRIREEWVPAIAPRVCSLAPLRNSDIFSYVNKLRPKFKATGGPEGFIQAVRASGTLDLHRVPLILAMSAGLYARKDYFEIPSSIAKLYQAMIDEMLDRHRFKRDPGGNALSFQLSDKVRFLREFALESARRSGGFDEFSRTDLVDQARSLAADLNAVPDPNAFVSEIVERSGLLVDVGESNRYVFAHRSIQEFLAAERLRLAGDSEFLLDRAANPEWRQVMQFYAVGLEQEQANDFLPRLAERNPELAGYCLSGATPSDDVARAVLDGLEPIDDMRLTALAAATMSPRVPVQRMAIDRLQHVLSGPESPLSAISGEVDTLLPLLNSLAGTNAAEIAGLVPAIIAQIPDDPRLVDPLWRCLAAPGIEALPHAPGAIVSRLLTLATSLDGFAELASQDPYTRDFLISDLRGRAYPFTNGLPIDHNLVTLLAWAEYLGVTPQPPNRYFEAKAAGALPRVEGARRRTIVVTPHRPVLLFNAAFSIAAVVVACLVVATDPGQLLRPFGGWTLLILLGVMLTSYGLWAITSVAGNLLGGNWKAFTEVSESSDASSHIPAYLLGYGRDVVAVIGLILLFLAPIAVAVAPLPLMPRSLTAYFVIAISCGVLYWMPLMQGFSRGRRYYLYRPSPYIDMYDDPCCRHWIVAAGRAASPSRVAAAEAAESLSGRVS